MLKITPKYVAPRNCMCNTDLDSNNVVLIQILWCKCLQAFWKYFLGNCFKKFKCNFVLCCSAFLRRFWIILPVLLKSRDMWEQGFLQLLTLWVNFCAVTSQKQIPLAPAYTQIKHLNSATIFSVKHFIWNCSIAGMARAVPQGFKKSLHSFLVFFWLLK